MANFVQRIVHGRVSGEVEGPEAEGEQAHQEGDLHRQGKGNVLRALPNRRRSGRRSTNHVSVPRRFGYGQPSTGGHPDSEAA
jgi:hypothetical protein